MRKTLLAALLLVLGAAYARIGEEPQSLLAALEPFGLSQLDSGDYVGEGGFTLTLEARQERLYRLLGSGQLDEAGIALASQAIGAATGYYDGLAVPVQQFFETRVGELSGLGPIPLGVEEYVLTLEVTGEAAPYQVTFALALQAIPEALFLPARHALGPEDARYVIREFSDFQCPACATFNRVGLPLIKTELLPRGDVRFEFHHLPLESIHANAFPAAEAAECVTSLNGPDAFWRYHDALFERQRAWAPLGDPTSYFVRLAGDLGLVTEGLEACLSERTFHAEVRQAYTHAVRVLGLSSTPSVFVGSYRVRNYADLGAYLQAMALYDAFAERD